MTSPHSEVAYTKAVAAHDAGRLQEASDGFQAFLRVHPGHAPTLHRLGVIAHQVRRHDVAASLIEAAVRADHTVPAYHNDLGEMYRQLDRLSEAERAFRQALTLQPGMASAANNLAILLHRAGRLDEAISLYQQAATGMPDSAAVMTNLGTALLASGKVEEALLLLERATALAPDDAAAQINLGNAHMACDRPGEAASCYRRAIALQPENAQAELNLGRALREQGRPDEALEHYQAAGRLAPALAAARWNTGSCQLLLGDYERGWTGFAERWRAGATPPHGLSAQEWDGGSLVGRRLLVHAEQGLGDTLQFVRFVRQLSEREPAEVRLLCQPPLHRLLRADGFVVIAGEAEFPAHELRVPLLDLPRLFHVGLGDLPGPIPYLHPDQGAAADWDRRLGPGLRIGVVWRGRREHANDRNRSLPLSLLQPLLGLPGTRWFSLQKERDEALPDGVEDLAPMLTDMADTAAALVALDQIVTVDTSVAHLAGALGKPVHLLVPFAPDWRWLVGRNDSPWYPTMRLYRQDAPQRWTEPVSRLKKALSSLT